MLSEDERRVLAMFCFNYQVAACRDCQRGFKLTETHVRMCRQAPDLDVGFRSEEHTSNSSHIEPSRMPSSA